MLGCIVDVVFKIAECFTGPFQRQMNYMLSYTENLENLKKQMEDVERDTASVQREIEEAERQGENIEEGVTWLKGGINAIDEAKKLVDAHESTPNQYVKVSYACLQRSKNAEKQMKVISKLREARKFVKIPCRTILEDVRVSNRKDYGDFESRMSTLNDILAQLKDPNVNILGIYGMGGVGKTTLVKEVARQVKSEFDQIIFVEVTQTPDRRRIQKEIAERLGMENIQDASELELENRLRDRLKKVERILIILDNVWGSLDLRAVGIPFGDDHKGCKILLTARSVYVLSREMGSRPNFHIGCLSEEEAWSLFKKTAGDDIEGSHLENVARQVAEECAGLPVSIVTVARALKNKRLHAWKDAWATLRNPSSTDFRGTQPETFTAIEMSYNYLEGEELKQVFLLIAYAYIESTDALLMYAMGLDFFKGKNRVRKARTQVRMLVDELKASCMLMDHESGDEDRFSMRDVVRDVAIAIACRGQNVLTLTNHQKESSDQITKKFYTSIVLRDVKTNVLPEDLEYDHLTLFCIQAAKGSSSSSTIPDTFFSKMKQVRVLDLTRMHLLSMPSSVSFLINLRSLSLSHCKLQDIAFVGNFKKLEVLCLESSEILQLSEEVGQLTRLKLLNLTNCEQLQVIPPNILSKLSHLEELYMNTFSKWEEEVEGVKNASIDELKHLPNLTCLQLRVKDVNTLPRDLFFKKLQRFWISVGDNIMPFFWSRKLNIRKTLILELNTDNCLKDGLMVPLKRVEDLCLSGLQEQDIKYFVYELVNVGLLALKHLIVKGSEIREESMIDVRPNKIISDDDSLFMEKVALPNLETLCLDSINIGRIWQSQLAATSCGVQNLIELKLNSYRNLKYVFSFSMLCGLVRLQKLEIVNCPVLKEIIIMDQTEIMVADEGDTKARDEIIFYELKILALSYLSNLTSFCSSNRALKFPSLETILVENCDNMKIFSGGELSTPNLHQAQLSEMLKKPWKRRGDLNSTLQQQYSKTKMKISMVEDEDDEEEESVESLHKREISKDKRSVEDKGQTSMQPLE